MKWKQNYNIHKVLSFVALMIIAHACGKDPQPEPEPEPIVPTKEVVVPWVWGADEGFAPPSDTIENYTRDPYVKYVFIYILTVQNIGSTWKPESFHRARDTLQNRINIDSTKVRGRGIVKVGKDGAQIHPDTLTKKYGMWEPDSLWFTKHGWKIQRFEKHK